MWFIRRFLVFTICLTGSLQAQFLEKFDSTLYAGGNPAGWSCDTGDGQATVQFLQGNGYATVHVDATQDKANIWWALIRTPVNGIDIKKLMEPDYELRVETRIRTSHAPRRVNLHFNHQRTTDYHSHLMEYDIPESGTWHTISMTTKGFEVQEGDRINAQMALMDWGLEKYLIDVDYFKVDVVKASSVGEDLGNPIPYHPPIPDPVSFSHHIPVFQDAMVDIRYPDLNFADWQISGERGPVPVIAVSRSQIVLLRWDLHAFKGTKASGSGLLAVSTQSLQRSPAFKKDFGMVRVSEILGGDPNWNRQTVTLDSFCAGASINKVLNSQMVIDYPVNAAPGGESYFVINPQVMQRLLDGTTRGLAIRPLGAVNAAFHASRADDVNLHPQLFFCIE